MSNKKLTFKEYNQEGLSLPPLENLIPKGHLARIVNDLIDSFELNSLVDYYKSGGTSPYNPKMLLKVLIYSYCKGIYSSRKISESLQENIILMWLSGMQYPDFRTINNFRNRLDEVVKETFASIFDYLIERGYTKLENYYIDGTKLEANANKHSWVWSKSVSKNKIKVKAKIEAIVSEIERVNSEDDEKVKKKLKKLDKQLQIEKGRLESYLLKEKYLGNRNSLSKTDTDATFMRVKDGRVLPAYNILIGTENQFILNYSLHQKSSETDHFIAHMTNMRKLPNAVTGDSAFGSEENYKYLKENKIKNFLKYNSYNMENKRTFKKKIFRKENFVYDSETDTYNCPANRKLIFERFRLDENANGFLSSSRVYKSIDCSSCSFSSECKKGDGSRSIQVNIHYERFKAQARANLNSEEGFKQRKRRGVEVESVFGNIKHNYHFRRFSVRGLRKVEIEFGLIAIAHNIRKICQIMALFSNIFYSFNRNYSYKINFRKFFT